MSNFGSEEEAMQAYFAAGKSRAAALNNRGPLRFTANGDLHPEIVDEYLKTGFYIFEGVLRPEELAELKSEVLEMIDRLPAHPGSATDLSGRPALGADLGIPIVAWSKPLGDPMGGTSAANGRAPVKMVEPRAAEGLRDEVPYMIAGPLQFSEAALRVYGHPGLLAAAATINGSDFTPFGELIVIKTPGEGASFAWHQDGTTHWNNSEWTPLIHGFNFMVQLFECTAANAVWFVPGSHAMKKADVREMVRKAGSNRLPDAVPLICGPGDVAISNRQVLHASFANTSPDWRVTLNMGFHMRSSVAGVKTRDMQGVEQLYDEEHIRSRSEVIGYAIDARRKRFPDETPFRYGPHQNQDKEIQWDEHARSKMSGYHLKDVVI